MKKIECDPDDKIVFFYQGKIYRKTLGEIITDELHTQKVQDVKLENAEIYLKENIW